MQGWPSIEATRRRGLLVAGLLALAAGLLVQLTPVLDGVEADTVDARFRVRPAEVVKDVAFVDVDAKTFSALKEQWPLPRSRFGKAARALHAAGAREIVFDVQFTEPSADPREDLALYDAIGAIGGGVLATTESDGEGRTNVLGGDANLRAVKAVAADANLPDETGGVLRDFPYETGKLATIAVTVARRAGRHLNRGDFDRDGRAWIDYAGPPGTVPRLSFVDVLDRRFDRDAVGGRIVVIGSGAPSLQDLHRTPTSGDTTMAGPEVLANAIRTAMRGLPLRTAPSWLAFLAIALLALAVPLAALRMRATRAALVAPVIAVAYAAAAYGLFLAGLVLVVAAPLAALLVATAATLVVGYFLETHERRRADRYNALLEERVRERTAEVRATQLELIERLSRAVELRDNETGDHVARISAQAQRLALAIGVPADEAERIRHASVLHDVGKIGVPDSILLKPGPLTASERLLMERHTGVGSDLLDGSASEVVQLGEVIARTHHEKWDGTGYPNGLRGEQIPLAGRIVAVVDVFDALTSARPYKHAWPVDEALDEIARQRGLHFDPEITDAFLRLQGRDPGQPVADAPLTAAATR